MTCDCNQELGIYCDYHAEVITSVTLEVAEMCKKVAIDCGVDQVEFLVKLEQANESRIKELGILKDAIGRIQ